MAIRIIQNKESFISSMGDFEKYIKDFIVIMITEKAFSFSAEYSNGILNNIIGSLDEQEKIRCCIPHNITVSVMEKITVHGYMLSTPTGLCPIATDLTLENSRIPYYSDRLNVLQDWGFKTAYYMRMGRRQVIENIDNYFSNNVGRNHTEVMIIPDNQLNNCYNNWPIILK